MGAFDTGFQQGRGMVTDAYTLHQRQQELDMARAAEDRRADEYRRTVADRNRVDDAYAGYANANAGVTPDMQTGLQRTYGMDARQVADAGPGLQAKLASYDQPDNLDLQNAPAPGRTAADFKPKAPTGPDAAVARAEGLMRIAAATRNPELLVKAQDAHSAAMENKLFAQGVEKFKRGELDDSLVPLVNTTHGKITLGPADKNGIRPLSVVQPDGKAAFSTLGKAEQMKLAGALELMEQNPTRALELIGQVNRELAGAIAAENATTSAVAKGNNEGQFHSGSLNNQRITANAAATSAGAQAGLARAHVDLYRTQEQEIKTNRANLEKAQEVASDFEDLTPAEQAGAKGVGLMRKYNMLVGTPGKMVPMAGTGAGGGKLPATLTDAEKEAYKLALQDIQMIPANKETGVRDPKRVATAYRTYGLDPARFGFESELDKRLKAMSGGGPDGAPAASLPAGRPFYNHNTLDLRAIARKPRGVSSEEAAAAEDELTRRQGEARIGPVR